MPLYPVNDFLADFVQIIECKTKLNKKIEEKDQRDQQSQLDEYLRSANNTLGTDAIENKITVKTHWSPIIGGSLFNPFCSFTDDQMPDSCRAIGTTEQKFTTTNPKLNG